MDGMKRWYIRFASVAALAIATGCAPPSCQFGTRRSQLPPLPNAAAIGGLQTRVWLKDSESPDAIRQWLAFLRSTDSGALFNLGFPVDFVVADPERLSEIGFSDFFGPPARLLQEHPDFDGDGRPDLLFRNNVATGNGGIDSCAAFRAVPGAYSLLGFVGLGREGSWRILPPTPDGEIRLLVHARDSCCSGDVY